MFVIKKCSLTKFLGGMAMLLLLAGGGLFLAKFISHRDDMKKHQVDAIAAILLAHALTYDIDERSVDEAVVESKQCSLEGFDVVRAKVAAAVAGNKPIELNLVGFPYKSQNTEKKVAVAQLDAAEQHSLEYLNYDDVSQGVGHDVCTWHGLAYLKEATVVMTRGGYDWRPFPQQAFLTKNACFDK